MTRHKRLPLLSLAAAGLFLASVVPVPEEAASQVSYPIEGTSVQDGHPATWKPCSEVTWQLNEAHAPPGAKQDVEEAFAALSKVSGLRFVDAGATTRVPVDGDIGSGEADITISWAYPPGSPGAPEGATSDLLPAGGARTDGGGVEATTVGTTIISTRHRGPRGLLFGPVHSIAAADVAFDATFNTDGALDWGGASKQRGFIQHELLHALGVGHTDEHTSVMAEVIDPEEFPATLKGFDAGALAAFYPPSDCTS